MDPKVGGDHRANTKLKTDLTPDPEGEYRPQTRLQNNYKSQIRP